VSVYVDDMRAPFGRMVMCHMIADSTEELNAMADRIGVARRWIQSAGTHREHYDVCKEKRALAVQHGAIEIDVREHPSGASRGYPVDQGRWEMTCEFCGLPLPRPAGQSGCTSPLNPNNSVSR
jgi:hypothetical protein